MLAPYLALAYQTYRYPAEGVDSAILKSSPSVHVSQSKAAYLFAPTKSPRSITYIFCPGGMVEPTAYAPYAHTLAKTGYRVYVVKLGAQYPDLEAQKRDGVNLISSVAKAQKHVVVGGHSLGAAIAAQYAHEHPEKLNGLILCATTHPRDFSLVNLKCPVLKIWATQDGIAPYARARANADRLPKQTQWLEVKGGNHAQFGYYSGQFGNGKPTIDRLTQQKLFTEVTSIFLRRLTSP
ncbi:MAG: hypothetical protein BGO01_02710 [Armatimonadetes bacterium 55-13]|nr:alpha/beta fold hydrolase [Armatimonadota bacterium]OJU63578.1 MAG: hypothetical protein BGO01_02710 [Armatimonadetes bacterium 55-13]